MKYIFLTDEFYEHYINCTEIEQKSDRPYVQLYIRIKNIHFAIPFRSNIKHRYVYWTDKANGFGLDYSKAVIIENLDYIDTSRKPYIREHEHKALVGKDRDVEKGLLKYIAEYIKAKEKIDERSKRLRQYSTLQYFEKIIESSSLEIL